MKWSKEKPMTSGLYWFRYSPNHPLMFMEIYLSFKGTMQGARIGSGDDRMLDLSQYGEECEFAGPIPVPS